MTQYCTSHGNQSLKSASINPLDIKPELVLPSWEVTIHTECGECYVLYVSDGGGHMFKYVSGSALHRTMKTQPQC